MLSACGFSWCSGKFHVWEQQLSEALVYVKQLKIQQKAVEEDGRGGGGGRGGGRWGRDRVPELPQETMASPRKIEEQRLMVRDNTRK